MTTKTYLIRWDAGSGDDYEVVHTEDKYDALQKAADNWESQGGSADIGAVLATRENLEEAGFDPDVYLIEEDE